MSRARERFELKKPPLGGGAFGLVYLAHDTELDQRVAIKIPHDRDKECALRKEAQLMACLRSLNEPHVVALYDLHEINGMRVIVMEYVEGRSLRAKLGRIGEQCPLEPGEALDIALQACLGLNALHNAFSDGGKGNSGIFHRDVKPENILLRDSDGMAKIADFGIAAVLESSGMASTTAGTLPYMAPELLEGAGADFRADIYSLGVTIYEMLTGRLPFTPFDACGRAKAPMAYGREICLGNPPDPSDVASVDREIAQVVLKAVHREVDKRYQSMAELRGALEDLHSRISIRSAMDAAWSQEDPTYRENALREMLLRFPASPETYRNLAWFLNRQVRFAEALKTLEEGRIKCPACSELLFDLAQVYHKVGEIRRAVDTMEQAALLGLPGERQKNAAIMLKIWRSQKT